ncbi:hypothetical protein NIES2135_26320 [Leptolyngbya boryana NIES-2135]|jgi:hypothetical protein|uniref:DUF3102 domain-containing protein n=1 Tax=Leptolyngbya boryana NIES-2135 TaxID=1973484 RepID=A0A1Z4JGN3_LEPBY|nr:MULTISPECIES: DUF3102 domain-containing protein [Leptolyngbya]BAY55808.1 hypothetical protein NIES2135_26320 [Leptolyngbya boryana NIES-2135]MBD2368887.1 DUF3102 domain-containing protein [Leptolyngbya sp. FACHB-161]MBD2375245.1 DUF3102 domain-containing protein [Leptolyngbya sp. FACHB-238]MBD2399663.1 DUF3102 domain-containing protein [Leptolyngbya sp. FACHB-239]MBD2405869.1 DUF3102 domain-containing protein [Leptolyngbya sp. FACHB-402]
METRILAPEFRYDLLDTETRIIVQQRTSEIRSIMKRTVHDAIEIGVKLLEVKTRLGHGHFGEWLSREFQWSHQTANNYMLVADKFQTVGNLDAIAPSALYLLASDSTPSEVRQEFIDRAQSGKKITKEAVKSAIQTAKLQPGDERIVVEPTNPLHGQKVTVQKTDGDVVYCETPQGTKPIAVGWLGTEADLSPKVQASDKAKSSNPTLSELLETAELALEVSRSRVELLQDWGKRVCEQVDLPMSLLSEAFELGIISSTL